jgi:hypothetical protein
MEPGAWDEGRAWAMRNMFLMTTSISRRYCSKESSESPGGQPAHSPNISRIAFKIDLLLGGVLRAACSRCDEEREGLGKRTKRGLAGPARQAAGESRQARAVLLR